VVAVCICRPLTGKCKKMILCDLCASAVKQLRSNPVRIMMGNHIENDRCFFKEK
jgi:hypothetical protein